MENQNERDEIEIDLVELFYVLLWGTCVADLKYRSFLCAQLFCSKQVRNCSDV